MVDTAKGRLNQTKCPLLKGNLWFDPRTEVVWQCQRLFGSSDDPTHAIIECSGFIFSPEEMAFIEVKRRMPVTRFANTFIYFGTVHHTNWRQSSDENI